MPSHYSIGNENSPRNGYDLAPLDVIPDKVHFRRVTLDIHIIIARTDATVAQLLALYDQIRTVPMIELEEPRRTSTPENWDLQEWLR